MMEQAAIVQALLPQAGSESPTLASMTSSSHQLRAARLETLSARLSDGEMHAIDALAALLQVSQRTLFRDLALLREQGWELESSSGKGGGVRILRRWPSGRITLRSEDAVELLMSLALAESMGLSPLGRHEALRLQFARCFAPADRDLIARLRQRMRTASPVSRAVQDTAAPVDPGVRSLAYAAFAQQRLLTFTYEDAQQRVSAHRIEVQCLLLAWPFWFLLAWDRERQAVRTFRLDRLRAAQLQDERFALRPADAFWQACSGVGITL